MKRHSYIAMGFLPLVAVSLALLMVLAVGCKAPEEVASPEEVADSVADEVAEEVAEEDADEAIEFVNVRCPMMGTELDLANVDPDLVRTYNGQLVAFCCPMCLPQWDALSDEERDAKLAEAE